jgi:hypothetical protein
VGKDDETDQAPDLRQEIGNLLDEGRGKAKDARKASRERPAAAREAIGPAPSVNAFVAGESHREEAPAAVPRHRAADDTAPTPSIGDLLGQFDAEATSRKTDKSSPKAGGQARAKPADPESVGSVTRDAFADAASSGADPHVTRADAVRAQAAQPELRDMVSGLEAGPRTAPRARPRRSVRDWLFAPRRRKATYATLFVLALMVFGGGGWWLVHRPTALQAELLETAARVEAYRDEMGLWPEVLTQAVELDPPLVLGDVFRWEQQKPGDGILIYGLSSDGVTYTLIARTADEGWVLSLETRKFTALPKDAL